MTTIARNPFRSAWALLASLAFAFLLLACKTSPTTSHGVNTATFEKALANGAMANEGFVRSADYMHAWLSYADPKSKLIPRNLKSDRDIWNANDCAADNYPFLVLTSYFTSPEMYRGIMREMLDNETRLTSRVKSLPDTYSFPKADFEFKDVSMPRIVFGTTEYIKDGLLPITEWLGPTPWSERMLTMLQDLDEHIDIAGDFDSRAFGISPEAEVNGELLQILSRVYWMTGEKKYLDWAIQIGDHFLGIGYPLEKFEIIKLRDHGCELISGLCELYVTLHFADPAKKETYRDRLYELLDFILEHGRNDDGLFFNVINAQTGEIVDKKLADTWGYTMNGYYSVYLIDGVESYRDAVLKIFGNLHKYKNYEWEGKGGADGYADAIEGALNLYNRIRDERASSWIESEIRVLWAMQDSSERDGSAEYAGTGIIEGWHGDGNFARTTIMYNLWKSQGTWVLPWRSDLQLGAEYAGDTLFLVLQSKDAWEGKIYFDQPRHNVNMKLPLDWPRINQFSEWFTVLPKSHYVFSDISKGEQHDISGADLISGLSLTLQANESRRLTVVRK